MNLQSLAQLTNGQWIHTPAGVEELSLTGITHNSGWVQPGFLFVAIRGQKTDAHRFLPAAIEKGAVAVVGEGMDAPETLPIPYLKVENDRKALGDLAAAIYGNPSRHLQIVGVTGTKGKTTTAWLTHHLLKAGGLATGLLSTLGYKLREDELHQFPAHFTTPEAPQLQENLARMVAQGCTHAVVEASSEALAQYRLQATQVRVAIWTNLAPEHLNFHKDMEGYYQAKRILIEQSDFAVLNADDEWVMRLTSDPKITCPYITYATGPLTAADWFVDQVVEHPQALEFKVHSPGGTFPALLPIIGRYNLANALAAMATAYQLGLSIERIQAGLRTFAGTPGRMQIIQDAPVRVIVDFAHTPDSLRNALSALRQTTSGRLIVVIGSAGGPRDPSKRAPLGAVAASLADDAIFTEEDCRDTPIEVILNEMKRGADQAGQTNYQLIANRYEAIQQAIALGKAGDSVVLCGKAGETTLERANEILPWIEAEIAREILLEQKREK